MSTAAETPPPPIEEHTFRDTLTLRLAQLGSVRVGLVLAIIWIIFAIAHDRFLTPINLTNLALQSVAVGTISVGVVLVLLVVVITAALHSQMLRVLCMRVELLVRLFYCCRCWR